jgi:CBS domain containing-hemolysin-like protein
MSTWEFLIWWSLIVLTFLGSFLCSGLEIGSYSLNRVRLDLKASRPNAGEDVRILRRELEKPARLLATLLISNNIVNAIAAEATTNILNDIGKAPWMIAIINTVVLGPLLFVLGDALPKADRLMPIFARSLRLVRWLLTITGVLPLVQWFAHLAERLLKLPQDSASDARQRIANLLKEGAGSGVLSDAQVSMLDRALLFRNLTAGDEMTPWDKVFVVPASAERGRVFDLVAGKEHAFFPVVDRAGKVVGVLRHLDLYTQTRKTLGELIQPVPRIAIKTPAREALATLRLKKSRVAIVEDATGRPIGLVTAKDLVAPLTGELAGL